MARWIRQLGCLGIGSQVLLVQDLQAATGATAEFLVNESRASQAAIYRPGLPG